MSSSASDAIPAHVLRQVSKELFGLLSSPVEGISLEINEDDLTDIVADIDGPEGTPYEGGTFRVRLVLTPDFPASPPKGYFVTKIFHPNVGKNGEICVNTLKRDWKANHGFRHMFTVIRCLLIAPNPESALNEEAGKLQLEDYDEYFKAAKLYTSIYAKSSAVEKGGECEPGNENSPLPSSTSSTSSSSSTWTGTSAISSSAGMSISQTTSKSFARVDSPTEDDKVLLPSSGLNSGEKTDLSTSTLGTLKPVSQSVPACGSTSSSSAAVAASSKAKKNTKAKRL